MDKKNVKSILMTLRNSENQEIVNNFLGEIDLISDEDLKNAVKKVGDTEESVRNFFIKGISKKMNNRQHHGEQHISINDMFSYGISGNSIHLHVPVDLHQIMEEKGVDGMLEIVNMNMLDAIDRIKRMKDDGYYKFQGKDCIYMISPALIRKELKILSEALDFEVMHYKKKDLRDADLVEGNPEAQLAVRIFGNDKNVGTARIGFDTVDSKQWQEKKQQYVKSLAEKGISLDEGKSEKGKNI